ncbi:MAG: Spy/CpxP family protein refolding chaperone [Ramlibacter sp.]
MKTSRHIRSFALFSALAASGAAWAQHTGHAGHAGHTGHQAVPTPYAGQQARGIKALSPQEEQDLMEGKGMGLAKAAELNGYPGPMHVLELAQPLKLSDAQRDSTMRLMQTHKDEARALGRQLVEAERELDQAFAARRIDAASLTARLQRISALQAAIRDAHLQTHLKQTALLTPAQISQYNQLRGYGGAAGNHPH